jgi:Cdc6-like AAA superfamily ATPase
MVYQTEMDPLSIAGSIAGVVGIADAAFRALTTFIRAVKNADADAQQLGKEIGILCGTLHSLFLLADALECHDDETAVSPQMYHVSSCSALLGRIEKQLDAAKITSDPGKRLRRLGQQLAWPFSTKETKELLADVQRHQTHFHRALSANSLRVLLNGLSRQDDIQRGLSELDGKVEALRKSVDVEASIRVSVERRQVISHFMTVNPEEQYQASRRLRHPLTGQWIVHVPEFKSWLERPASKLWLSGIPGAGKTVLSSTVIEEALRRCTVSEKDAIVAYFYCDYRQPNSLQIETILGALLAQIANTPSKPDAFDLLKQYYDELRSGATLNRPPSTEKLIALIRELACLFTRVFLVIDGVDECGESGDLATSQVTRILSRLADDLDCISIAIISRREIGIADILAEGFMEVEISAHSKDVKEYVSAEIERRIGDKTLRLRDTTLKDEIRNELVDGAKGM